MKRVSLLDCTLRDGGWMNDFEFGKEGIVELQDCLDCAGIEYIEVGYLDEAKGSTEGRSMYSSFDALIKNDKRNQAVYLLMVDYGKYPLEQVPYCESVNIDGIRVCFHKKDAKEAVSYGKALSEKGYRIWMQPMVCHRYTEEEFVWLLEMIQKDIPKVEGVYIVDSFGSMKPEDIEEKIALADSVLDPQISIGLHSHNSMNLAFENAKTFLEMELNRDIMIDGTLYGMGKGAGNLLTEEIARYLNQTMGKTYDVSYLKKAVSTYIMPFRREQRWGYCKEYYLSAKYQVTPSYAKAFLQEYKKNIEEVEELIKQIPDDKKDSFDREVAKKLVKSYEDGKNGFIGC